MTFLLLLISLAQAAEPEIQALPPNTEVSPPDKPSYKVPYQSYLLPESHYDRCLAAAKNLPLCEADRTACHETAPFWMNQATAALDACSGQFDTDQQLIDNLTGQVQSLEKRALTAEAKVTRLRQQRNIAIAVVGGVVLTGAAAGGAYAVLR